MDLGVSSPDPAHDTEAPSSTKAVLQGGAPVPPPLPGKLTPLHPTTFHQGA